MKVLIAGAGIGGLAAALSLHQARRASSSAGGAVQPLKPARWLSAFGEMSFASRFTPRTVAARRNWFMSYDAARQTA